MGGSADHLQTTISSQGVRQQLSVNAGIVRHEHADALLFRALVEGHDSSKFTRENRADALRGGGTATDRTIATELLPSYMKSLSISNRGEFVCTHCGNSLRLVSI